MSASPDHTNIVPATMDAHQASAYLGLSHSYLAQMRMSPEKRRPDIVPGPAYRCIGKKVVYLRRDLDAWLESLPIANDQPPPMKRGRPTKAEQIRRRQQQAAA